MSEDQPPDPAALFERLVGVLRRAEPVPSEVVRQAKAAYMWRDVAASIALLEYDSAVDDDGLARVRGTASERVLRFAGPGATVHLSVIDGGQRLVGRLDPAAAGTVELRHPDGAITAEVDHLGRFLFETSPRGSVSLRCTPRDAGTPSVKTEWVTI